MVEAGESEYSGLLKTLNLLIFRDAKNAEHGRIAANWNVSGTRDFQPAVRICEEFTSPLSTSYPRVTFACRPNFPEGRFTDEMRRPVSRGMRYAPNDRRARGAIEKETGYGKD
jgi:hypothetical protein